MRLFTLVITALVSLGLQGYGQSLGQGDRGRTCGTEEYTIRLMQEDPTFGQRRQAIEQAVQQALQQKPEGQYLRQKTITIPVVFHVVYNQERENISDEQILSQLAILNADFRRLNQDAANTPPHFQPFAADTEIEFCLATIDPNGDPTTGITRTRSSESSFNYFRDNVKDSNQGGINAWDRNQYLNIWICNIDGNILGYAAPPGTAAARDGVVLYYQSVGAAPANPFPSDYNLGRTATHEVGHWLGLQHIWGNGSRCDSSDGIDDTPTQLKETEGCPTGIVTSCDNGPYGNMFQNYMDYSNDACMNLFTRGQAAHMQAILTANRSSIINSVVCTGSLRSDFKLETAQDSLVLAGSTIQYTDASVGVRPTSWLWEFEGGTPAVSTQQNPKVTYTRPGRYSVSLTISNGLQTSTEIKENFVHVTVSDLVVYPNPASDYITIEQPARTLVRQVELVNRLGQVILSQQVRDRVINIDIRHLPAGIYFLHIAGTQGPEIKRINIIR